ncbi:NifB/NifX family molybdenum-iron cluster-binding protein [uncultured Flavonifractor sp.]|uniref:NifB/NifX family molybdenum-iron cluster-binding protein n=1 Tax=uncultured Flavonifractor sp. TaxID=1193534 RepID=UPI00260ECC5C|nr:NifB/NifX family molybdenum-iron cluster-binding protein [uncultured Flavonifractor sp.]
MKLAVTYENGQVFQHFGHTEQFKLYEVEDGKVVSAQVVDTNGSGHGALAGFLAAQGVEALICGGIGGGARNALAQAGIRLFSGAAGDADAQVNALLAGSLRYDPDTVCAHHHDHGEAHDCGSHGGGHSCGGHSCG